MKGNVDIKGRNYSKGLNKQDINLTDRLLVYGAIFNPKKYELVHLTRRPKKVNIKAAVCFGNIIIESDLAIRILGLQID